MKIENEKKLNIQCDCDSGHFISFLSFEDEDYEMYVSIYGCEIVGFFNRLKMAFKILLHGEYENDGVLVEADKLLEISKYCKSVVKSWEEHRKELLEKKSNNEITNNIEIDKIIKL